MDAICPSAPQAQAPSGILESTAQVPVPIPIPTAPKTPSTLKPQRGLSIFPSFFFSMLQYRQL